MGIVTKRIGLVDSKRADESLHGCNPPRVARKRANGIYAGRRAVDTHKRTITGMKDGCIECLPIRTAGIRPTSR